MKRIITFIVTFVLLLSVCGCNKVEKPSTEVQLWSTYNTSKIMQKDTSTNREKIDLKVKLAKGEVESGQFFITPKFNVAAYNVTVSDLHQADGTVFAKENISVFMQKYINIEAKSTGNRNAAFPTGRTPDALLPFATAVEYKENKIAKNDNQGITVDFKAPRETKAGIYTGAMSVDIDGKDFSVPVELTVWDFEMPKQINGKGCFLLYPDWLMGGELESSDEIYQKYFDMLLENKISVAFVPGANKSPQDMAVSLKKYYNHENFSSYMIPEKQKYSSALGGNDYDYNYAKSYLKEIILNSTESEFLLDKAYYYMLLVDEPNGKPGYIDKTKHIVESFDAMHVDLFNELVTEGFFNGKTSAFKTRVQDTLYNLDKVITGYYDSALAGKVNAWCPTIDRYDSAASREIQQKEAEALNGTQWWYTCLLPTYPYPSHHIDDYTLGARISKWMQKAYNVEGYLYWSTSAYVTIDQSKQANSVLNPSDPYEDTVRFIGDVANVNGDGYLTYPAKPYNLNKPVSSLRIAAIRDGQDDYDYLCMLEDKYKQLGKEYNTTFDLNKILKPIYEKLFNGTVYETSDAIFEAMRLEVANLILDVESENGFILDKMDISGTKASVSFFVKDGYTVTTNDVLAEGTVSGSGKKYVYTTTLDKAVNSLKIKIEKDGKSIIKNIFLSNKVETAIDFATADSSVIILSQDSVATVADNKANITVKSKNFDSDVAASLRFKPSFALSKDLFGGNLSKVDKIIFGFSNTGDKDISFTVALGADKALQAIDTVVVPANSTANIEVSKIYSKNWDKLNVADKMVFYFANDYEGLTEYKFSISNVYYSLMGDK